MASKGRGGGGAGGGKKIKASPALALSAEQEETLSSEYIAKLLSRDFGYRASAYEEDVYEEEERGGRGRRRGRAGEDEEDEEDEDEEYRPTAATKRADGKRKTAARKAATGEKPKARAKAEASAADAAPAADGQQAADDGMSHGSWTEDEEARFREALDLYGREWAKVAAHVRTRNGDTCRSKAQKYFIKLFRSNLPLPAKVAESGAGYTLSGKPLDPNSAAARPYLRTGGAGAPLTTPDGEGAASSPAGSAAPAKKRARRGSSKAAQAQAAADVAHDNAVDGVAGEAMASDAASPDAGGGATATDDGGTQVDRTDYSRDRLRPKQAPRASIAFQQLAQNSEPHTLVRCRTYGEPGVEAEPFAVTVSATDVLTPVPSEGTQVACHPALLAADLHAHLQTNEVIGFCAGKVADVPRRAIAIERTHPCKSLVSGPDNVEMDPASDIEVRHRIFDQGRSVVGWYHSHPYFQPDPSLVDIQNQGLQQQCSQDEIVHDEPFVGLIVGTYDPRLPNAQSVITAFHLPRVAQVPTEPRNIRMDVVGVPDTPERLADLEAALAAVVKECAQSADRIHLSERWKVDSDETKLHKLLDSLRRRLVAWLGGTSADVNPPAPETSAAPVEGDASDPLSSVPARADGHRLPHAEIDALLDRLRDAVVQTWQPPPTATAVAS